MSTPMTPERLAEIRERARIGVDNRSIQPLIDRHELLAEVDRLRAQCGATRPDYPSVVPCMLPPHDDRAPHWSTSGCVGGAVQWFNQELDHWPGRLPAEGPALASGDEVVQSKPGVQIMPDEFTRDPVTGEPVPVVRDEVQP